jgi:hypothetical protein
VRSQQGHAVSGLPLLAHSKGYDRRAIAGKEVAAALLDGAGPRVPLLPRS